MVYSSLSEIADKFEVFLFDAYGVFWNGGGFYKNSKEIILFFKFSATGVSKINIKIVDKIPTIAF